VTRRAGPYRRFVRWRAGRIWLRDPRRAVQRLGSPDSDADLSGQQLSLRAWLALTYERDAAAAERFARAALERGGDTRFASVTLAEVLQRQGRADEAIEVLWKARSRLRHVVWYDLTIADALEAAGRVEEAVELLHHAAESDRRLHRHAVKRLARIALERGDGAEARRWFEALVALAPDYLVYASDYATLGKLQLQAGERDRALETWRRGARIYPRHAELAALRAEHFGEDEPLASPRVAPVAEEEAGVTRIPTRTPLIGLRSNLLKVIDRATADVRQPGDVIALAESATAAAQGRILPLELVQPGLLARLLSNFVGEIGPLHSHEGMQGAIMESGRIRVILGAIAGGVGRRMGRRGWFYRVAGPRTAMIDDVAACMPPNDHHLIFGPIEADALTRELADGLGCGMAVVDANHLTGAWVLAASPGVDREWLAAALADNPAGNEDEQTPVVIVRRTQPRPAPEPVERREQQAVRR
jgi:tetratricopeptide (TPR) repeat protein